MILRRFSFVLPFVILFSSCAGHAAEWFVASDGSPTNAGTEASPWDIESALGAKHPVAPGDTVWISGGTYRSPDRKFGTQGFPVRLAGADPKPIVIRAKPGERVTIDGGLSVVSPADWVWIRDLEILLSENLTQTRHIEQTGSSPGTLARPWSGLNINTGTHCKFINLVIHDNIQGVSWWSDSHDSELYGCIIYDNGWEAPDRGHGHAIYTQNATGTKTIADCIMTGGYGYTLHAYGSAKADVDHYLVDGNICYDAHDFLIGGGKPSHDIKVTNNILFGMSMRIGYSEHPNEDCEVRDNVIINGTLSINHFAQVVNEGNQVLAKDDTRPAMNRTILRVDRYDPNRANVVAFRWDPKTPGGFNASGFLQKGDRFRLLNPRDFYGKPLLEGEYDGNEIPLPVKGEFGAFVMLKMGTTGK